LISRLLSLMPSLRKRHKRSFAGVRSCLLKGLGRATV
jgi:hypothetical protein